VSLEYEDPQTALVLDEYRLARMHFGLSRIKMGSYLHLIQENKLWRGRAESWSAFLAAENLQPNAIRQYINVARTYVFELDLPDNVLAKLSLAGISAMEKAGKIINDSNKEEVISALTTLAEKDAVQRIIELSASAAVSGPPSTEMRVLRLLKEFYGLPPDMQSDFKDKLLQSRGK
jgi:hypothetical protein